MRPVNPLSKASVKPDSEGVSTTQGGEESGRAAYWQKQIAEQARSGLTARAFCQERDLGENAFYSRRRRQLKDTPSASFALVETSTSRSQNNPCLERDLGFGQCLRIPCGADAATLRTVLSVLRERGP